MKNFVKILTKKKLKIAFAESCTGGMLASEITSISGASKVFSLGLVTYSNQAKNSILKVGVNEGVVYTGNPEILKKVCPGVFGVIRPVGYCMIGQK